LCKDQQDETFSIIIIDEKIGSLCLKTNFVFVAMVIVYKTG